MPGGGVSSGRVCQDGAVFENVVYGASQLLLEYPECAGRDLLVCMQEGGRSDRMDPAGVARFVTHPGLSRKYIYTLGYDLKSQERGMLGTLF